MSVKKLITHYFKFLAKRFGYILIPISEIDQMREDGISSYETMKTLPYGYQDRGYFNGVGDYACKKSRDLKKFIS